MTGTCNTLITYSTACKYSTWGSYLHGVPISSYPPDHATSVRNMHLAPFTVLLKSCSVHTAPELQTKHFPPGSSLES